MNRPPQTGWLVEYTRSASPDIAWVAWWRMSDEIERARKRQTVEPGKSTRRLAQKLGRDRGFFGTPMEDDDLRRTICGRDGREETWFGFFFANDSGDFGMPECYRREMDQINNGEET